MNKIFAFFSVCILPLLTPAWAQGPASVPGHAQTALEDNPTAADTAYYFDFNTCSPFGNVSNDFTPHSLVGDSVWQCTGFGRNGSTGVQMNGYNAATSLPAANEDWLISPRLDLSQMKFPLLNFYSQNRFAGPSLRVMVSANYSGAGNPALANWTELNAMLPAENTSLWTLSDSVNLSNFKQDRVYVAWVYRSDTAAAARWTLDDISIINSETAPAPAVVVFPASLDFGYIAAKKASAWRSVELQFSDVVGDLNLTVPKGFEITKDTLVPGTNSIEFTRSELAGAAVHVFYARFLPTATDRNYAGSLLARSTGLNQLPLALWGTSLPASTTLEVVNWNIEWFGSPEAGLGPVNKNLQAANILKILRHLDADIYALVEVVDTIRFRALADSLGPDYGYVISGYGTRAIDTSSPFFEENYARGQKLGYIYKKSMVSNIVTRPFLLTNIADTLVPSSYYWWSSGRFPFLMQAEIKMDGVSRQMNFILLHAKANTSSDADKIEAYARRKNGALQLKDTLDMHFPDANLIVLGDFNDELDRTIAPTLGADTVSSYKRLVEDSTDAISYRSVTLPFSRADQGTSVGRTTAIDNVVISNEVAPFFVGVQVRTDVVRVVAPNPNVYSNTTSDHYPILARYRFNQTARCFLKRIFRRGERK